MVIHKQHLFTPVQTRISTVTKFQKTIEYYLLKIANGAFIFCSLCNYLFAPQLSSAL